MPLAVILFCATRYGVKLFSDEYYVVDKETWRDVIVIMNIKEEIPFDEEDL